MTVLATERLILRIPHAVDFPACAAFWASTRSHMMSGPLTAEQTAREFGDILAQWRRHGFGLFTVTRRGSDQGIGGIGPFYPDTHPEPELVWSLWDAADEGKGYAFEAAVAARDWFFATTPHRTAVSYTDVDNYRSHRLCLRIGGAVDATAQHPYGDDPTLTFRYHARGLA